MNLNETATTKADNVNHPAHYCKGGIECIKAIEAFKGYLKGCCLKYLWRYEVKGGVESLQKARVYIDWLIEQAQIDEANGAV